MPRHLTPLLALAIASYIAAATAADGTTYTFNLPEQTLADTLRAIGRQTALNIVFAPETVEHVAAPPIRGEYTAEQALTRALAGTKLRVEEAAQGSFLVEPTAKALERELSGAGSPGTDEAPGVDRAHGPLRLAQAEGGTPPTPQATERQTTAERSNSEPRNGELQEIVVTATRREEVLSKVPISVSAYTQEAMDQRGIKDFADVARFTPGVSIDTNGTSAISIRGIASSGGAGTTGIYIDDTPIQIRALGFGPDDTLPKTFDLQRVEILRGPQGTLFGAGSEGGTVRYILTQPSVTKTDTYVRSELAGTQDGGLSYEAGVAQGGPIVQDTLGVRASVWYRHDAGWIDRVNPFTGQTIERNANDGNTLAMRLAMLYKPVESVEISPSVVYQDRKRYAVDGYWPSLSNPGDGRYIDGNPAPLNIPDRYYLPMLKVQWELGPAQLISNTSYYHRLEVTGYDSTIYNLGYYQTLGLPFVPPASYPLVDASGLHLPPSVQNYRAHATLTNQQDIETQEIRLQSTDPNSRLQWTVGGFWSLSRGISIEENHEPQIAELFQGLYGVDYTQVFGGYSLLPNGDSYILRNVGHDRQLAGFGELTLTVIDGLKVTAGARISSTEFDFTSYGDGPHDFGPFTDSGKTTETPFTPKFGLSWQIDPNDMVYANYAKGFRTGGANAPLQKNCGADLENLGIPGAPASYKSDSVKSYEIGVKSNIANRLRLAASAFYIQWDGIQQNVYLPGCGLQFTGNFGQAVAKGFDLQADFALFHALSIESSIGYTDARFSANSPGDLVVKGDAITGQAGPTPPWTAAVGVNYDFTLAERASFVRLDYEYQRRSHWLTAAEDPRSSQYDPYALTPPTTHFVSLRSGITFGRCQLALFVDNLFDSRTLTGSAHSDLDYTNPSGPPPPLQYGYYTFKPRTIGLDLNYRR